MINNTSPLFFEQLYLKYKEKLIIPKINLNTLIDLLISSYNLKQVDAETVFDYISHYSYFINNNKDMCEFFLLDYNENTNIFYNYYNARFSTDNPIYFVINKSNSEIMSNCDLFEIKVNTLKGIDNKEILNRTSSFKDYLNLFYLYDIALGKN